MGVVVVCMLLGAPSTLKLQGLGVAEMKGSDMGVCRQGHEGEPSKAQGLPAARPFGKEAVFSTWVSDQSPRISQSLLHSRFPDPVPHAS